MAETEPQTPPPPTTETAPKSIPTFSIWPPSQRTRDAVTTRLIQTLTSESVLSKRYGTVPEHEATDLAKKIEEEAFATAGTAAVNPEDDGIETLQVYSKEISKKMLEAVKSRSENAGATHVTEPEEEVEVKKKEEEETIPAADVADQVKAEE